jgi:CRP-like cAMP-binding protein
MEPLNELSDLEMLFRILTFIAPLSGALRRRFEDFIVSGTYPKKHRLLSEGEISRHIFFICKGSARAFYLDADGREHTTWFMGPWDLMISVYSFYTQQPAAENIELLESSVLLSMTWNELQTIYAEFPEYNYHGRLFTEKYYILSEERGILLRTRKPADRYHMLLKQHPQITQQASLGQIASFLGITPETLSRIRAGRGN